MSLLIIHGAEPKVLRLSPDEPVTLGRSAESTIVLDDPEVSRRHCQIVPVPGGGHKVLDLNSRNGTYLNGRSVRNMVLESTDQIVIGQHLLVYADDEDEGVGSVRGGSGVFLSPWSESEVDSEPEDWGETRLSLPGARPSRAVLNGVECRDLQRQEILLRIGLLSQGVASQFEMCRLMNAILDELIAYTGHERGLLLLYQEDTRQLQPVLGRDANNQRLPSAEWSFARDVVGRALDPEGARDPSDDTMTARGMQELQRQATALCLPLRVAGRLSLHERRQGRARKHCLGAIYLDGGPPWKGSCDQDAWLVEALVAHAASALRNARLHHMATTDILTGLNNRSFMMQVLEEELRLETELSVILLDLDHFKRVNDTYGHGAGDEVLARVAQRIQRALRCDDYVGRWGGEEFLILLPGEDLRGGLEVARKVGAAISSKPIGDERLRVTASMGLAVRPLHAADAQSLVSRADVALYAAKGAGRNRVQVYRRALEAERSPVGGCWVGR